MKFLGNPSSGSLAGTTFSHNRAGQYQRNRRSPVQPIGNGRRAFIRAAFANCSQGWSSLTSAQQAAWTAYAVSFPVTDALGQSITLTGQQMYVSINTQLINVGQTAVPTVPISQAQDNIAPVSLDWGTIAAPLVTVEWTGGSADNFVTIAFSGPVSNGVNFMKTFCQLDAPVASLATDALLTQYTAQFGVLTVGQKVFCRVCPVNQYGVTGTPTIISSVVARV